MDFVAGVALAIAGALFVASCGSGPPANRACVPGASVACTCPDARSGAQICNASGTGYEDCVCARGRGGAGGGGTDGTGGAGGTGVSSRGGSAGTSAAGSGGTSAGGSGGLGGAGGGSAGSGGTSGKGGSGATAGIGGAAGIGGKGGTGATMVVAQCRTHATGGSGGSGGAPPPGSLFVLAGRYGAVSPQYFGDVNGDGYLDIVNGRVWLGCGDGTFSTTPIITKSPALPTAPSWELSGDFTGDRRMDLVDVLVDSTIIPAVANTSMALLPGQPDATFAPPDLGLFGKGVVVAGNAQPIITGAPAVADVYGHGTSTIVFVGYWPSGTTNVPVLYSFGAPTNFKRVETLLGSLGRRGQTNRVEVADIDGDGHADAIINATLSTNTLDAQTYDIWVRGNGDGSFKNELSAARSLPTLPSRQPSRQRTWADLDGDGRADAILTSLGSSQIYWNEGGGTFSAGPQVATTGPQVATPVFGDFDGDGRADFLTGDPMVITFGDGARGFGRALTTPFKGGGLAQGGSLSWTADVNGDGVTDLLFQDATGVLSIYVSTAKNPKLGPPDIDCSPLPADQCTGPLGF